MKNKKEEIISAYVESNEQLTQLKQQQLILFGICAFLITINII